MSYEVNNNKEVKTFTIFNQILGIGQAFAANLFFSQ